MARLVAGIGLPHTPTFPSTVAVDDDTNETSRLFSQLATQLDAVHADVLLMFDSDHLNTFFLDNMPTMSIGVASQTRGPNDSTPGLAPTQLLVPELLSRHVRQFCVESDFDVALSQDFTVDHSILVPLHYLRPPPLMPVLPVFINGLVPPLPAATRCRQLGRTIRDAVHSWPDDVRVAVVASGSFSLEVGGPAINPASVFGVPAPDWAEQIHDYLAEGELDALVESSTRAQLAAAGNVGGELLNWIAMLSVIEPGPPVSLQLQPEYGHGFGFWDLTR